MQWLDYMTAPGIFSVGCVVGYEQDSQIGILAGILTIAPRRMAPPGPTAILHDADGKPYPPVQLPGWVGANDFKVFLPYASLQNPAENP